MSSPPRPSAPSRERGQQRPKRPIEARNERKAAARTHGPGVTESKSFLIWGAGGHGRVLGDVILAAGHGIAGYIDGDEGKIGRLVETTGAFISYHEDAFLEHILRAGYPVGVDACALGIGSNRLRLKCLESLNGLSVPTVIHPSASISSSVAIGRGSVIFPNAVINAGASIGQAVIVNSGAIVEHDCRIESGVHISPGAVLCGGVSVGKLSWVGAGSTVIQGIKIGSNSIVGAGSTVIRDVDDSTTVVGSPAHPIRRI